MFLARPAQLLVRIGIGFGACLVACSLQVPSESEVFGVGAKSAGGSSASGGLPGGAGMLGVSGSHQNGGAGSPGGAGVNNGSSGASGSDSVGGSSAFSGSTGFDPAAGLVAYFTFDEPIGSVAANAEDSNKNAKCIGTCTRPDGQIGQAFGVRNVSGPSDWIELPVGIFGGRAALTLSVWLRDRSSSRAAAPLFHFSSSARETLYFVPDDRNGKSSATGAHLGGVHAGAPFVDLWSATPVLTDKVWHHVAISWSAASIELYLDGKSVGRASSPTVLPSQLGSTSPNYLGRGPDNTTPAIFGEIDDLRIYDRALSAAQVALLYKVR